MEQKVLSVRVPTTLEQIFRKHCEKNKVSVSSRITGLMGEELKPKLADVVAGNNLIKYDSKTDSFEWVVTIDVPKAIEKNTKEGRKVFETAEFVVLKRLSKEFVEDLIKSMSDSLKERDYVIGKKNKGSVGIPKNVIGELK